MGSSMSFKIRMKYSLLTQIKNECLKYQDVESGGRFIGSCYKKDAVTVINIEHIINAGPNAERTAVSLFQDRRFQRGLYNKMTRIDPSLCYIGSWHHHLCNGLRHASSGDFDLYHRTANHENHQVDFFIGLVVVPSDQHWADLKFYLVEAGSDTYQEFSIHDIEFYHENEIHNLEKMREMRKNDLATITTIFPMVNAFERCKRVVWKGRVNVRKTLIPIELVLHPNKSHWIIKTKRQFNLICLELNRKQFQSAGKLLFDFCLSVNPLSNVTTVSKKRKRLKSIRGRKKSYRFKKRVYLCGLRK